MEKFVKFFQQSIRIDESKMKPEHLNSIVLDFQNKVKLKQGWNLFQEGDPTDCLYLIKKGEIQLSKQVKKVFNATTQNYDFQVDFNNSNDSETHYLVSNKKEKAEYSQIDFVIVSQHEFIGSEDLFYNKKYRTYTAKCLSDVTLYSIQKSQLLKVINDYFFFKISMQKYAHTKHQHHIERIQTVIQYKQTLQEKIKPFYQKSLTPTSQKDYMIQSNPEKVGKSIFQKQGSIQIQNTSSQFDASLSQTRHSKSKTITFLAKKNINSPQLNSIYFPSNQQQASMKFILEQTSQTNIQNNQIPSLLVIDEGQTQINQPLYINNGVNNPHVNQQKHFDKKIHHTESIANNKDENQTQYLDTLKSTFQDMNYFRGLPNEDQNEQNLQSLQTQFWFDQNMKNELDRKINHCIKEKDPTYVKKIRQTFKGNMETGKYGILDKKLNKLIQSKPKLISNAISAFPEIENNTQQNDQPFLSSRKISEDVISRSIKRQKTLMTSSTTQSSSQNIQIPNVIKQEQQLQLKIQNSSKSNKKATTPKGTYSFNYNNIVDICQPTNDGDDNYQFGSQRMIKKQSEGFKTNSVQLSPLKLRDYEKIKHSEQQNSDGLTSLENLESTRHSKKKNNQSLSLVNHSSVPENMSQKQSLNNEQSINIVKKTFSQTKEYSNSANAQNKKQNEQVGNQSQRQELSIFSNQNLKEQTNKSQKLIEKSSLINFYKNKSNKFRKTTFDTPNLEQFI